MLRSSNGYRCASFDRDHHRSMDFLAPAGYVFLSLWPLGYPIPPAPIRTYLSIHLPRLTLMIAMNMVTNGICIMGPDCSSWGLPARGSSRRSNINIFGYVLSPWVQKSTQMITRFLGRINMFGLVNNFSFTHQRGTQVNWTKHEREGVTLGAGPFGWLRLISLQNLGLFWLYWSSWPTIAYGYWSSHANHFWLRSEGFPGW